MPVAALTLTLRAAPKMSFYAIFDGHGGRISAELCEHHLLDYVLGTEAFKKGEYVEALKEGFHKMEGMIAERARTGGPGSMTDGCTAVAILMVDTKVYCANIGDSEAIVGRMKKKEEVKNPDDVYDFTLLTEKHLPSEAAEKERLQKAGATIISNRVNGILAVSRSFGDLEFKAKTPKGVPAVIVDPHVMTYDIGPLDQFIVLACDGLWDTTTYEEAVRKTIFRLYLCNNSPHAHDAHSPQTDTAASARYAQRSPVYAAEVLVKDALDDHTMDNVTVIVVYLQACPPVVPTK